MPFEPLFDLSFADGLPVAFPVFWKVAHISSSEDEDELSDSESDRQAAVFRAVCPLFGRKRDCRDTGAGRSVTNFRVGSGRDLGFEACGRFDNSDGESIASEEAPRMIEGAGPYLEVGLYVGSSAVVLSLVCRGGKSMEWRVGMRFALCPWVGWFSMFGRLPIENLG